MNKRECNIYKHVDELNEKEKHATSIGNYLTCVPVYKHDNENNLEEHPLHLSYCFDDCLMQKKRK